MLWDGKQTKQVAASSKSFKYMWDGYLSSQPTQYALILAPNK